MVNLPVVGAIGAAGFQAGCKYRYELGSFCNRPTRTSATMRPPTGPSVRPLPSPALIDGPVTDVSASFRM